MYWIVLLVISLICGFVGGAIAGPKQKQMGFWLSFLLWPIGWIIAAVLRGKD